MPNYSKVTLARIGRLMNSGEPTDPPPLAKLAKSGAFGRKAIYNWSLPETDPQHREMPPIAKRLIAMLAYFSAAGLLNDKRMEEIIALETTFENEKDTNVILRRIKRVIGGGKTAKAEGTEEKQPAAAETAESEGDDGPHGLGDDAGHGIGHIGASDEAGRTAPRAF